MERESVAVYGGPRSDLNDDEESALIPTINPRRKASQSNPMRRRRSRPTNGELSRRGLSAPAQSPVVEREGRERVADL